MPLYDYFCESCSSFIEDHFASERPSTCERCCGPVAVPPQLSSTIGIVWGNQEDAKQLGARFETNAQKREFFKKNPQIKEMAKGSVDERKYADRLRNRAEDRAKRLGYKDLDDKRQFDRANRDKGVTTVQAAK
jgi:hypothetical protein